MDIISKIGKDSKINIFKQMLAMRRDGNYHFMPSHLLELQFTVSDPYMILGFLLRENWGVHRPQTGQHLVQTAIIKNDRVSYEVVLYMNDAGIKSIYLMTADRRFDGSVKTMYIASTGYYEQWCDGLDNELYSYEKPMYRKSDDRSTKWVYSLEEAQL